MTELKILIQGYSKQEGNGSLSSSTCVLVKEKGLNILVDPGIAKEKLALALKNEGLKPEDIQYILLTHSHVDHAYAIALFPSAKILDDEWIYDGDKIEKHDGFIPGTELAIIHTPGHTLDHCSLAVSTEQGMVVIAGDVFWWPDHEEQKVEVGKHDEFAVDRKLLIESREKILKIADFVIPGHGKMFRVEKQK